MAPEIDPFLIQPEDDDTLHGKYKLSWIEDSLEVGNTAQDDMMMTSGTSHINSSFSDKKFFYILLCIALAISVLLGRLMYIQLLEGSAFAAKAEGNRQRIIPVPSERGLMYDANNIQLTYNIPNFSLAVIPQDLPRDDAAYRAVIDELADITDISQEKITATLDKYRYYRRDSIIVEEDIPYETALRVQIATQELPGIYIHRGSKRLYVSHEDEEMATTTDDFFVTGQIEQAMQEPSSLSHVLGYMGKLSPEDLEEYYKKGYLPSDSLGKTGLEKSYEEYLRGTYGKKRIEVDARGKEQALIAEEAPYPGQHLKLHLDAEMQAAAEDILQDVLQEYEKNRATVVALDPRDGAVKALVSWPGYDNNDFSGGIDRESYAGYIQNEHNPLFNRAIAGTFPSGSVVKPMIAAAALQEGIITATTRFLSTGGLVVGPWFFPDWRPGGHGSTDVRYSLEWSVNTFYYYIGGGYGDFVGLGINKINEYLQKFGFSHLVGIDIPGEAKGFVPSPEWKKDTKGESWYVGDTYNTSIGQGDFLTTPLQMAVATAAIANGGTVYKPQIVDTRIDAQTDEITDIEPEVLRQNIISPEHIQTIKLGMMDCVDSGSCWMLRSLPYKSGGKTGTAQWSNNKDTHAWFTAFAPFENPEIIIVVLVEEGGEGGVVALPIASRLLDWWNANRKN